MASLHLPENAPKVLEQASQICPDNGKFLVYATIEDLNFEQLCHEAMSHFVQEVHIPEDEWEESGFIMPAPSDIRIGDTVQEILNNHIELVQKTLTGDDRYGELKRSRIYPFGLVVVESREYRSQGVTLIFCEYLHDFDDARNDWMTREWRVEECNMDFEILVSRLSDLVLNDEEWKDIKRVDGRATARMN